MAATLTATLLTAANPQPVQIALTGTNNGDAYTITGTTTDGSVWTIPGGAGVSAGSQVLVTDNRAPLNVPVTYQAVVNGATISAAAVTIAYSGVAVLQTLNGRNVVGLEVGSVTEKQKHGTRVFVAEVAGSPTPAVRLDVPGSAEDTWELHTQLSDTAAMRTILGLGTPVVRRLQPGMRDLQNVVLGVVTDWHDELLTGGGDTWRCFYLTVREITDPQPSAALAAYAWTDFDTAFAKPRVWSYYSTLPNVSGLTATNGTLSSQSTGGYTDGSNTTFGRLTVTTAATAATVFETAYTGAATALGTPVVPAMVVTITMRVKGTSVAALSAAIKWSGGTIATGTAVTLTGAWQQISVTATAPAGTTGLAYGVSLAATGAHANDQVDVDAVTISQGTGIPVGTFDELFATWDAFDAANWAQYF